jgi:hypothetical protein
MKTYYRLPTGSSFAFVARTGTTAILCAVIEAFPDYKEDWCCESVLPPDCLVVIREPVQRFRSLLWAMNTTASEAIEHLTNSPHYRCGRGYLSHFRPVSTLLQPDSRLLRFGDIAIWNALGLTPHTEVVNATPEFPVLSDDQEKSVRQIYAEDIVLWESVP